MKCSFWRQKHRQSNGYLQVTTFPTSELHTGKFLGKTKNVSQHILTLKILPEVSVLQIESDAFTRFGCGDAACFPVCNWRMLHTQMKGRCWCSTTVNFRGDRFSTVLENQMQIWWRNFGVWRVTSHWLLPGKYSIPLAIRLHRTSPKHDQGGLREDLAVEYSLVSWLPNRDCPEMVMWMLTLRSSSQSSPQVRFFRPRCGGYCGYD